MKVLADNVIIKEQEKAEKTPGGIIIAPSTSDRTILRHGTVLEVGSGTNDFPKPEELSTGKTIIYDVRNAIDLTVDGQKFVVIKLSSVVAVLD